MFNETRLFVNSKMELIMKIPPVEPFTEAEEAARSKGISVNNMKPEAPKALLPKPLANYLLKTTELTEKTLLEAQTAPYTTTDVILVRCRFDNENQKHLVKDVVMTCPATHSVSNVQQVLAAYLQADNRLVTLNMYLDSNRRKVLSEKQDLRGLVYKDKTSLELVLFVKFESSDKWKEEFVFETATEEHGESNEKTPSTSAPMPEAQPTTSQQSSETPASEKQNSVNEEEGSDDMPHLDMETPCEEPEQPLPPSVELSAAALRTVSLPKTGQSEARIVYVDRSTKFMQPPRPRTIHRPPLPPQQREGAMSVNVEKFYSAFTVEQKLAILEWIGFKQAVPKTDEDLNDLTRKLCHLCSPTQVMEWLQHDHAERLRKLVGLERAARNTDKSSVERNTYSAAKSQCDQMEYQITKLKEDYQKIANMNDLRIQQQRHFSQIQQNRQPIFLHPLPNHAAVPNGKFKLGTPVSVSQSGLNHLIKVKGKVNVGSSAKRASTATMTAAMLQKMVEWDHEPSERPITCDYNITLQAIAEYVKLAIKHEIPANEFLEIYNASKGLPKKGTMVTRLQYEGFHSRTQCNRGSVVIPYLDSNYQKLLFDAVLAALVNKTPESLAPVCKILGWEETVIDMEKWLADNGPPAKMRRVDDTNDSSTTSSERSFASNMSSPGNSEQQTTEIGPNI